jgi:dihydrofolate synthase/folylpolyglutamate synthase
VTSKTPFDLAMAAIWERSGYDRGFISNPFAGDAAAALGLVRTRRMLDRLGNPDRAYPIVHVAGSKGKGSTSVLIEGILRASGLVTGRFLSPHLHSYRERFVIDGVEIPEADFADVVTDVLAAAQAVETDDPAIGSVTAWELSTAMALLWFQGGGCDVAVIEVGLGGTLDATNVIVPAVSVITRLDFEHTAILGTTMAGIAANKAGIIKDGHPAITADQPADGLDVIVRRAKEVNSPLLIAGRDYLVSGSPRAFSATGPWGTFEKLALTMVGDHQMENAGLAIAAAYTLLQPSASRLDDFRKAVTGGLLKAVLPARFERVVLNGGTTVVIDGAHTGASMSALARTLEQQYPGESPLVVVGMLGDKDPETILEPLWTVTDRWLAVAPANPRALDPETLVNALRSRGLRAERASSTGAALHEAQQAGHRLIVVTGSLSTAAEAREALGLFPN